MLTYENMKSIGFVAQTFSGLGEYIEYYFRFNIKIIVDCGKLEGPNTFIYHRDELLIDGRDMSFLSVFNFLKREDYL